MQKVIIIGMPGAGKSTLARALRDKTGLPLYYLDMLWHKPDRTNIAREEFDAALSALLALDRWIIDGNYNRTLELRLKVCDTVFFLDYPLEICFAGAASRIGKPREDMPWIEECFDPDFQQYIRDFPNEQVPRIKELLAQYRDRFELHVFHSREECTAYLKTFGNAEQLSKNSNVIK